ncbi:unnamed protein product [Rhizoctonia solani]|uniref:Uncharacterized protein n=1 Tax=Rhizoctonia solani TaxID=456999 RepID=A0A8H3E1T4_9AGAM|nr:unnamed protein product [Rhizoctonia solani]
MSAPSPLVLVSTLPPNLQPVTNELIKFVSPHVKPADNGQNFFDWPGFKNAMDNYPGVDIVIEGFNTPNTSKSPFKDLPSQIAASLIGTLNMPISDEVLIPALKATFDDLQSAKDNGTASFKQISPGKPGFPPVPAVHGWEIRALLLAENVSRTADFAGQVSTVQIASSKLSKEEDWYQLDEQSTQEITVDLVMMKLGVSPEFTELTRRYAITSAYVLHVWGDYIAKLLGSILSHRLPEALLKSYPAIPVRISSPARLICNLSRSTRCSEEYPTTGKPSDPFNPHSTCLIIAHSPYSIKFDLLALIYSGPYASLLVPTTYLPKPLTTLVASFRVSTQQNRHVVCTPILVARLVGTKPYLSASLYLSVPPLYFNLISTLPQDFKGATGHLVNFFSAHVNELPTGAKQLNWASLKDSVDNYPGIELVIEGFSAPSATTRTFKDLPDYCATALREPLSVPISSSDLSSVLSASFSDLKYAKQAGWADFKQRESTARYGWEYRILTMVPNPSLSEDFVALLSTIHLDSPNIPNEPVWYEANQLYSTDVSVKSVSMKLAVNKEFQVPTTCESLFFSYEDSLGGCITNRGYRRSCGSSWDQIEVAHAMRPHQRMRTEQGYAQQNFLKEGGEPFTFGRRAVGAPAQDGVPISH